MQNTPVLKIPVSSLRSQTPISVELKFDDPLTKEKQGSDGSMYTLYTYRVAHDGQEYTMFAYDGLYNAIQKTGAGRGDTVSIVRVGTGKETKWDVELQGGPPRQRPTQPQRQGDGSSPKSYEQQPRKTVFQEYDEGQLDVIQTIMTHQLMLINMAHDIIGTHMHLEFLRELSADELNDVAISLVINAGRTYRPGMVLDNHPVQVAEQEQVVLGNSNDFIKAVQNSGETGRARIGAMLDICASAFDCFDDRQELALLLKSSGFNSGNITGEPSTWTPVYEAAKLADNMYSMGASNDDVVESIKSVVLNVEDDGVPF